MGERGEDGGEMKRGGGRWRLMRKEEVLQVMFLGSEEGGRGESRRRRRREKWLGEGEADFVCGKAGAIELGEGDVADVGILAGNSVSY